MNHHLFCQNESLTWMVVPRWEDMGVTAAFSTRRGGQSQEPFCSLNMGLHVGDVPVNVLANRRKWLAALNIDCTRVVCAAQVHSDRVAVVSSSQAGAGFDDYGTSLPEVDGMVTSDRELFLMGFFADCIPVLLLDSKKRAVGLVHSGWKGTVRRIGANAVHTMAREYGSRPEDIEVFVGPGIGACCYQVDSTVAELFAQEFGPDRNILRPGSQGTHYLDLKAAVVKGLLAAGVKEENIMDSGLCTGCRRDLFFSYRGEGGKCGRMAAVIGLR